MQFIKASIPGIVDGSITLTFRGWTRAHATVGSRHRAWGQLIEIDDVRLVDSADITDADARQAGEASAAALLARLGPAAERPIWRVQFHHAGPDDRIQRRSVADLDEHRRAEIQARLDRMDKASRTGPWTNRTLRLIATYPGVVSTALARQLNADRPAFKINVRKLKEIGLTESLEVGYRLSPLGQAFTGWTDSPDPAAPPIGAGSATASQDIGPPAADAVVPGE